MSKQKPFNPDSPEIKTLRAEISHAAFINQGTMTAFPLCFPGVTTPIPPDESFITALDISSNGIVYGGTSGRRVHLFAGIFHGVTGAVFDMGIVEGAEKCVAVCCGEKQLIAFVNGPGGNRAVRCDLCPMPNQLMQEWHFDRNQIKDLGGPVPGEKIIHAVTDKKRKAAIAATEHHLVSVNFETGEMSILAEIETSGQITCTQNGNILGFGTDYLWCFDTASNAFTRNAVPFPDGTWDRFPLRWSRGSLGASLYTADNEGRIFAFDENEGFAGPLGKTPLLPVGPMTVTFDGRLFGFCGEEISRMFSYNPATRETTDIGVAISFLERRRYGYVFADAITGRDGQIFFGEDDNLGHLWIYFPRIQNIHLYNAFSDRSS